MQACARAPCPCHPPCANAQRPVCSPGGGQGRTCPRRRANGGRTRAARRARPGCARVRQHASPRGLGPLCRQRSSSGGRPAINACTTTSILAAPTRHSSMAPSSTLPSVRLAQCRRRRQITREEMRGRLERRCRAPAARLPSCATAVAAGRAANRAPERRSRSLAQAALGACQGDDECRGAHFQDTRCVVPARPTGAGAGARARIAY